MTLLKIKEWAILKHHNLLRDPPLTRMNLVLYRYVLIYISSKGGFKVVNNLIRALVNGSALMLSPSECIQPYKVWLYAIGFEDKNLCKTGISLSGRQSQRGAH